jgi:hypothetical protein
MVSEVRIKLRWISLDITLGLVFAISFRIHHSIIPFLTFERPFDYFHSVMNSRVPGPRARIVPWRHHHQPLACSKRLVLVDLAVVDVRTIVLVVVEVEDGVATTKIITITTAAAAVEEVVVEDADVVVADEIMVVDETKDEVVAAAVASTFESLSRMCNCWTVPVPVTLPLKKP